MEKLLGGLRFLGFREVESVERELVRHEELLGVIAANLFGDPAECGYESLLRGISLFLLCYILIAKGGDEAKVSAFLQAHSLEDREGSERLAKDLVLWYRRAIGEG
ncbi:MAG: hypothetical protein HQL57_03035 [Magnetococcales bacterium]|nr:hypothetical protein [Magnetococcales bacterium]